MVMKQLLTLARRSQRRLCLNQVMRLASSAIAAVSPSTYPLLTYGLRIPTAELFAKIDAVDASTVKHVSNKYIYDKGPIQELPDYNWFRRRTYWNRY